MKSAIDEIVRFWFGQLDSHGLPDEAHQRRWFAATPALDSDIRQRYLPLLQQARNGKLRDWTATAKGRLAFILLTDQFSRHIYRGEADAFAADPLALAVCREGIRRGEDRQLAPVERAFFYMPLEHAESLAAQEEAIRQFTALARDADTASGALFARFTHFAREHCQLIHRFGRFPHRNQVLGRASTDEEKSFLEQGAAHYGQR